MPVVNFTDDEIRALVNILATRDCGPWIVTNPLLAKLSQTQGNARADYHDGTNHEEIPATFSASANS